MQIRIGHFTLIQLQIRIRILLLIKAMRIQTLQGFILSIRASIVSVHGPPWLFLMPLKLLNYDFNADPDPAFHCTADPDPAS